MQLKKKQEVLYLDYLKDKVYPDLHTALISLIDYVVKTEEVRKHQERLKKIKIFDKLEQKRADKERLKAELGSDYESSEDSMDWEELGINKDEANKLMNNKGNEQMDADKIIEHFQEIDQPINDDINLVQKQFINRLSFDNLGQIQENEENYDDNANEEGELIKMKQYLQKQREEQLFNPLQYLAKLLRETQNLKK